jgi:hypothetical protein
VRGKGRRADGAGKVRQGHVTEGLKSQRKDLTPFDMEPLQVPIAERRILYRN